MFYTKITQVGLAKLTAAQNSDSEVTLQEAVLGDGNGSAVGEPTGEETALVNQVYIGSINAVTTDPNEPLQRLIEIIVPASSGGFKIFELGIKDSDGDLIAYGNFPEHYKPAENEGSTGSLIITAVIKLHNDANITLNVQDSIFAPTRGGRAHQVLVKASDNEQDTTWRNQINSRSYFMGQL